MKFLFLSCLFLISIGCTLNVSVTDLNSHSLTEKNLSPNQQRLSLRISNFPPSSFSFSKISTPLKIEIINEDGTLNTQTKKVRAELSTDTSGTATLLGTLEVNTDTGIAEFQSLAIDFPGSNYVIKFILIDGSAEVLSPVLEVKPLVLNVTPFFPINGSNFMDYLSRDTKKKMRDQEDRTDLGTNAYFHGGEIKKILLPENTSCDNLTTSDFLDVFNWVCDDESSQTLIYSTGFKKMKGLRDLLEPTNFKNNKITVRKNGTIIGESSLDIWWTNPITPLTLNSGAGDPVLTLNGTSGTIYTVAASTQSRGIQVSGDRIGLVTLNSAIISNTATLAAIDCGPGEAGTQPCLFAANGAKGWIEAQLNYNLGSPAVYTGTGAFGFGNSRLWRIHNTSIVLNHASAIGIKRYSGWLRISDSFINAKNGQMGIYAFYGYYGNYSNLKIIGGTFAGVYTSSSIWYQEVNELEVMNSGGIGYDSSAWHHHITNSKFINNASDGLRISGNTSSVQNSLITNNGGSGLTLISGDGNHISGNVIANNTSEGILLANAFSTDPMVIDNNILLNNATGFSSTVSKIKLANNIFKDNNTAISVGGTATDLVWSKKIILDNNLANCNITSTGANPGLVHSTCNNQGASTATLLDSIDTSGYFIGTQSDTTNTHSSGSVLYTALTDWFNFDNIWRSWTKLPSGSKGNCSGANTCQVFDYKLSNIASEALFANGTPIANQACPISISGENDTTIYDITNSPTYNGYALRNAMEVYGDLIGNDNGFCESNETCLYMPHIGVFQGNTSLPPHKCNFQNGTNLQNIKIIFYD